MKTAQLYGQIFIYILTILIISLILIYGYSAISNFRSKTGQIASLKLSQDLAGAVKRMAPDFGSVIKKEIDLGEAGEICFVENYENPSLPSNTAADYPIIQDSVNSGTGKNVFVIGKSQTSSFAIGKISVDPDRYCINAISGNVELRIEGMGDHVFISRWKN